MKKDPNILDILDGFDPNKEDNIDYCEDCEKYIQVIMDLLIDRESGERAVLAQRLKQSEMNNRVLLVKLHEERRLKEIQVKVEDQLVWRYELNYVYSEDTQRSLLHSITQSGHDGQAFPTQIFTYQKSKENQ